jgi:ABC-type microcin C transport system permease subunit YejE
MLKNEVYVEATRSLGANDFTILFKHLLPNAIGPVVVAATIGIGQAIVLEATLGFLPAAVAQLGCDDEQRYRLSVYISLGDYLPRPGHDDHRAGV